MSTGIAAPTMTLLDYGDNERSAVAVGLNVGVREASDSVPPATAAEFSYVDADAGSGAGSGDGAFAGSASPRTSGPSSASEDDGPDLYRPNRPYKGFSTSISSSMFASTRHARSDCCALACFGILQSDRTRYLLTGVPPPSLHRRFVIHLVMPVSMFLLAGYCAVYVRDAQINQLASTFLVLMTVFYVAQDCTRGTTKRVQIREEMLWRAREVEGEIEKAAASNGGDRQAAISELEGLGGISKVRGVPPRHLAGDGDSYHGRDLGQSRFDMGCAHRGCGCYGSDIPDRSSEAEPEDVCGCIFRCFADLLCSRLCGCALQCCGCCALAQEAREIERLVPEGRRRIDYLSFEPYVSYYGPIRRLRETTNARLWDHYGALSRLSSSLLKWLGLSLVVLSALAALPLRTTARFRMENMAVLLATFAQAFLILYLVHWRYHKFDLSLDAVIKYFSCGFVLITGLTVFFETIITIFLQLLLAAIILLKDVRVKDSSGYQGVGGHDHGGGYGSSSEMDAPGPFGSPLPPYAPLGGHGNLATFAQAFLILYLVHWRYHKFDLSLDAVIKYFSCGFVLITGLTVFFETIITIFLQLLLAAIILLKDVRVKDSSGYQGVGGHDHGGGYGSSSEMDAPGPFGSPLPPYAPLGGHGNFWRSGGPYNASGEDYVRSFARSNPGVVVLYLFLNAYAMAALVEELTKYFGYRMVEHPDFLSDDQMRDAAAAATAAVRGGREAEGALVDSDDEDGEEEEDESKGGSGNYAPPPESRPGRVKRR